jgi:glycosyltransferase involved in cell wall biosynthesis
LSTVSEDLKVRLSKLTDAPITVIPNPLPIAMTSENTKNVPQRPQPRLSILISVNNGWNKWKNVQTALIAFSKVRQHRTHLSYHLFGVDYQPGGPADAWARKNGITDGLVFHGHVPHAQLAQVLKHATLMLHPSLWEGCPLGIAESMACGLPIIAGRNSGGVAAMVGDAGLLVDISNPTEISAAIDALVTDTHLYDQCSRHARIRVKLFDSALISSRYEALYIALLADQVRHSQAS